MDSHHWPFTVAWIDCLAAGTHLGRGLFTRASWAESAPLVPHDESDLPSLPFDIPGILLNKAFVAAFNQAYRLRPNATGHHRVHYEQFFYPLDRVPGWNRLYGRRGFLQHQSVIPPAKAPDTIRKMLELTSRQREGSFLMVIKEFGSLPAPGLLSFPREGTAFALDFPYRGPASLKLVRRLGDLAIEAESAA
jgi:L-gulonolactone oxidase